MTDDMKLAIDGLDTMVAAMHKDALKAPNYVTRRDLTKIAEFTGNVATIVKREYAELTAANAALVAECERLRRKYAFRLNQLLDVREELSVQDHLSEGVWAELCNIENRENHYAKEPKDV